MTTPIAYIVTDDSGLVTCEQHGGRHSVVNAADVVVGFTSSCVNPKPAEIRLPLERECEACGGKGELPGNHPQSRPDTLLCVICSGTGKQTAGIVWGGGPGEYDAEPMDDLCRTCWGNERHCLCPEPDYVATYALAPRVTA